MASKPLDPNARKALDEMKYEIANELGISYGNQDRGDSTSRKNGYIGGNLGGNMTRRLVEMAEKQLINRNRN